MIIIIIIIIIITTNIIIIIIRLPCYRWDWECTIHLLTLTCVYIPWLYFPWIIL